METPKGVFTYTPVDADGKLTQPTPLTARATYMAIKCRLPATKSKAIGA